MKYILLGLACCLFFGCAYHNPLDKADFRFQTLNAPPYILSGWYRVNQAGQPLTVYVEKEQMDLERRKQAVADQSDNVAYLGRPCQYFQTPICHEALEAQSVENALQKGILQLQKKAATETVLVKGLE